MLNYQQLLSKKYPHGYYKVNAEIFDHKISALTYATKVGKTPTWHFHRHVYESLNWQVDLPIDLSILYQQRARQLREKYDYLVMSFSGGSDSWTAIQAFIDSNTHLDEIFVRWPVAATQGKFNLTNKNTHASNILSEWELTIIPMLEHYRKIIPRTKITIHDWSNGIEKEVTEFDWSMAQDHLNIGNFLKYQSIGAAELAAIEKGKRTAIIYGTDKPRLCVDRGNIYCYFLDHLANIHAVDSKDHLVNRVSELFYWTSDLPELVLVQAREIYQFIKDKPNIINLVQWGKPIANKHQWNNVLRNIVYKQYSLLNMFQANKPSTNVLNEVDYWLSNNQNLRYTQSWQAGLTSVMSEINSKFHQYKDTEFIGFVGYIDGMYLLGPVTTAVTTA